MGSRHVASPRLALLAVLVAAGARIGLSPRALSAAEPGARDAANYARPFEPPTRPAFIPLPPGAIEPQGWLGDWCRTARDGYTGHMDEVHEDFRKSWAADYCMTGDRLSFWWQGAWPYEGGGYWFDGMLRLGYALHDDFLLAKSKARLDVVVDHMNEKSILFLWWLDRNDPAQVVWAARPAGGEAQEWPVWTNGFMGRSLAGYFSASGDRRVLRALELAYGGDRSLIGKGFALTNPWPAFETYTWTGNKEIAAALTELFAAHRIEKPVPGKAVKLYGSWYNRRPAEDLPWYRQPDHTVHFNESVIPWTLGYLWTGDREFLDAACRWYDIIERGDDGMQPHGVPVGDENAGPTGSFRGTETCNVSSFLWAQITLLRVGGRGTAADRAERAFFNAAPAVVSRDFRTSVYSQTPNRIDGRLPGGGPFLYRKAHQPLCCTASLNRMLPYYVTHMWMATYDDGLAAAHYGPCRVCALAGDRVPVEIVCRTAYPFDEVIDVAVKPAREAEFPLSFRVPGWCARPEIAVNGAAAAGAPDANGFVRIERRWKEGDGVRLRFPMAVRVHLGHDNDAADTPYATVSYGPLLFALPIPDTTDANTPDPAARWNCALDVPDGTPGSGIEVELRPMPARWDWPLESPLRLRARAVSFDWKPVARRAPSADPVAQGEASPFQPKAIKTLLPAAPVAGGGAAGETIVLVPYGCAKFRVAMLPITERAAKALGQTRG